MKAQPIHDAFDGKDQSHDAAPCRLLFVGSEDAFKSGVTRLFFGGGRLRTEGLSKTLLDGLSRIESGAIDLVLLSDEFRDEELSLFAFDAYRRGFTGLILRVALLPSAVGRIPPAGERELAAGQPPASLAAGSRVDKLPGSPHLTPKQRAVVRWISEGWSNQEIGRELSCSEGSVKAILQQLFRKFGVRKRAQIVRLAIEGLHAAPQTAPLLAVVADSVKAPDGLDGLPLEQGHAAENSPIQIGDFVIDVAGGRAWVRGSEAGLTPREFKLLTLFSRHPQELLSHDDLIEALWGNRAASRESLRVLIRSVRSKIETTTSPRYVLTQPHYGYRFVPSQAGPCSCPRSDDSREAPITTGVRATGKRRRM